MRQRLRFGAVARPYWQRQYVILSLPLCRRAQKIRRLLRIALSCDRVYRRHSRVAFAFVQAESVWDMANIARQLVNIYA